MTLVNIRTESMTHRSRPTVLLRSGPNNKGTINSLVYHFGTRVIRLNHAFIT